MSIRTRIIVLVVGVAIGLAVALSRVDPLALPKIAEPVTPAQAGLGDLDPMKAAAVAIRAGAPQSGDEASSLAMAALSEIGRGLPKTGLLHLQEAVRRHPTNLLLGNLLRIETLQVKRAWRRAESAQGRSFSSFPDYLHDEPIRFFTALARVSPSREVKLQQALAWIDHTLLFPALEIKAPASIESVGILSSILNDPAGRHFVPALYARGLNYLYRPADLVWPEKVPAAPDAASRDLSLAIAIARKSGAGGPTLKGRAALALGDAYAKEGRLELARSWWQMANNLAREEEIQQEVFTRLAWDDHEVGEKLAAAFDQQMSDLDHPPTDLEMIWR